MFPLNLFVGNQFIQKEYKALFHSKEVCTDMHTEICSVLCTMQVVRSNDTRSKLERCLAEDEIAFENRRFASIINTIFTGNKAGSHGGGVYAQVSCFAIHSNINFLRYDQQNNVLGLYFEATWMGSLAHRYSGGISSSFQ